MSRAYQKLRAIAATSTAVIVTTLGCGLAYANAEQDASQPAARASAPQSSPPSARAPRARPSGYLPVDQPFDGTGFLPPFPGKGSSAEAYDIAAWRGTAKGADTARWKQAITDDQTGLDNGLTQFQCAVGVTLDIKNAPTLMSLLGKVQLDGHWAVTRAKLHFKRPRPFADDDNAPICLPVPKAMRGKVTTAYPGGHSTLGMSWGLILAELAPDRGEQIMSRVYDYSQSRLVCGIHYPSDLEAGHVLGAGLVARLHGEQAFRKDMDAARLEVSRARVANVAAPVGCPA